MGVYSDYYNTKNDIMTEQEIIDFPFKIMQLESEMYEYINSVCYINESLNIRDKLNVIINTITKIIKTIIEKLKQAFKYIRTKFKTNIINPLNPNLKLIEENIEEIIENGNMPDIDISDYTPALIPLKLDIIRENMNMMIYDPKRIINYYNTILPSQLFDVVRSSLLQNVLSFTIDKIPSNTNKLIIKCYEIARNNAWINEKLKTADIANIIEEVIYEKLPSEEKYISDISKQLYELEKILYILKNYNYQSEMSGIDENSLDILITINRAISSVISTVNEINTHNLKELIRLRNNKMKLAIDVIQIGNKYIEDKSNN